MTIAEIISQFWPAGIGGVIILGTLIKIKPLEINLWGWLAKKIGKALNADLKEDINKISQKVDLVQQQLEIHRQKNIEDQIGECRRNILIFNDELMDNRCHSQERYENVLEDIDKYERYCAKNPDYPNNKAVSAIRHIKEHYEQRLRTGGF